MSTPNTSMSNPRLSLSDLLGKAYTDAVCEARAFAGGVQKDALVAIADAKVELAPAWYQKRLDELVACVGKQVCGGLAESASGAATTSFRQPAQNRAAPLAGFGFIRIGEDGRAYLTSKSEHYHASLGHYFPGYELVGNAATLGITNATHNNTRGHVTRILEQELVRAANNIAANDDESLTQAIESTEPHVLNRVINLETGSLAVEAALKMVLARFYRIDEAVAEPAYRGRTPVLLVMADHGGGRRANYHGTTTLTQIMRGMWPEVGRALESSGILVVRPVGINDEDDIERALAEFDTPPYKVAAFVHEIILMNYGGIRLEERFLERGHALCREHDVPVVIDEIQSCLWSPQMFLFHEYGLRPDFVAIGKGFPGGQYAASRIITTAAMDNLPKFGALVTNGQEELASLTYLVTMAFARANGDYTRDLGDAYASALNSLARKYPRVIDRIEGRRHLSTIVFYSVEKAARFAERLSGAGIDASAQTYKAECPPVALTKIPLISTYRMVDFLVEKMDEVLKIL